MFFFSKGGGLFGNIVIVERGTAFERVSLESYEVLRTISNTWFGIDAWFRWSWKVLSVDFSFVFICFDFLCCHLQWLIYLLICLFVSYFAFFNFFDWIVWLFVYCPIYELQAIRAHKAPDALAKRCLHVCVYIYVPGSGPPPPPLPWSWS